MLEKINKTGDIREISPDDYDALAKEIREFLVQKVSVTGGHLASNLGIVELTMALHLVFDFNRDKVIWDVGHQSYVHKILTGRKNNFDTLRKLDGMSGFPKRGESRTDCFDTGHSSNSVSAGLGMVSARDICGDDYSVISVIGDGAATGGMFFEALNNAGRLKTNFIIILNDNEMSISQNLSGMACYLSSLRTATSYNDLKEQVKKRLSRLPRVGGNIVNSISDMKDRVKQLFIPEMMFENLGVTYLGPIDGHNTNQIVQTLREAKNLKRCVLIHVVTTKGKGYCWAEQEPDRFHGIGPFDVETGRSKSSCSARTWTDVFSDALLREGAACPRLTVITAAMPDGTGTKPFGIRFPQRFFDVGIAEEHAVTFAAGQAACGLIPVVAVYSSFLQRAYDQILEDVCMQDLHVVFAVDRAGIVGADGQTHQGLFDASFLSEMPNMTVIAPKNASELEDALHYAIYECSGPVAVRYGRGACPDIDSGRDALPLSSKRSEILEEGTDATLFAVGTMVKIGKDAAHILRNEFHLSVRLVNVRFIKPLDTETLRVCAEDGPVITLEEGERIGGFGERAAAYLAEALPGSRIRILAVDDRYVPQGTPDELRKRLGLDADSIAESIASFVRECGQE